MNSLRQEFIEYISNNNNRINDTTRHNLPSFHIHNGEIRLEIHLAVALRYFTDGSYLDITISHGIGKTDVYRSFGLLFMQQTDAPDNSFDFQQQWQNVKKLLRISCSEAKQALIIVFAVLMECCYG